MSESDSGLVHLPTREGYDRWAEIYDDEDNPLIRLEHTEFQRLMGEVSGLRILDVGCGTGRHALALSDKGARVTAVDFSGGMLDKARAKPGAGQVEFLRHDITSCLPFRDGAFDRVVCGLVVDHIANLAAFFADLGRVCKVRGAVVVTVMHPALMLRGVRARFTDPATGQLTLPASQPHQVSDYVMAALSSGHSFERISEYVVDESMAAESKRAQRYLGWPMLLVLELRAM